MYREGFIIEFSILREGQLAHTSLRTDEVNLHSTRTDCSRIDTSLVLSAVSTFSIRTDEVNLHSMGHQVAEKYST